MHTHTQPSAAKGTAAYLNTYREEWREVFIISAEIYAFGLVMYLILASGEEQYWANGWPPRHSSDYGISSKTAIVENSKSIKRSVQIVTPPMEKTKLLQSAHGVH